MTISSSARHNPDEVARRTFSTSRRGFETGEVRAFLEQLSREIAAASEREQELRELLADAEYKAKNPVLDEEALTNALGQETAKILHSAREAASEVQSRAQLEAARLLAEAEDEAAMLRRRAEENAAERAVQAQDYAAEARQRAQREATALVEAAHAEADALVERTRTECRSMLNEAQELRARVLGDLTRRRRVLHSQIEQLRAGRERLAQTIGGVRNAVDEITEELFRAEDEARRAAETAGRQLATREPVPTDATIVIEEIQLSGEQEPDKGSEEPQTVEMTAVSIDSPAVEDEGRVEDERIETEETEAGEPTPTDDSPDTGERSGSAEQTVEELFARLRAEHSEDSEHGSEAGSESAETDRGVRNETDPGVNNRQSADKHEGAHDGDQDGRRRPRTSSRRTADSTEHSSSPSNGDSGTSEAGSPSGAAVAIAERSGEGSGAETTIDPSLVRRDELLGPVVDSLARRLKRALSDDQNDILDRLRASKGKTADLLPPEDEHLERYSKAALAHLEEASDAGTRYVARPGSKGAAGNVPNAELGDLADELASTIVIPLRRRMTGDDDSAVDSEDEASVVERIGAAFRDWKGARVERLAGDQAIAAFSRGQLAYTGQGVVLSWVVDDGAVECPDCEDNALAGGVAPGEAYPTGHIHPPAHAGCRCLLSPIDA